MSDSGNEDIRVMVVGEKGAGKSTIANQLFGFHGKNDEERFPERDDSEAIPAMGSLYLRKDECIFSEEPNPTIRRVHVVEVLGFLGENVSSPQKNWNDIVNSFEFLKKEVDVFLLVLNVNCPKNSEVVTRAFVDFFGAQAGLNTMVLFTHSEKKAMANRSAMFAHGAYLEELLRRDVPYQILPSIDEGEFPRFEILDKLSAIKSDLPTYDVNVFKKAQMGYMQKWVREMRSQGIRFIKNENNSRLEVNGVPDVLLQYDRYYKKQELSQVFS